MLQFCRRVADEVERALSKGVEKPWEIVKIGADGAPTARIDLVAENAALRAFQTKGYHLE